MRRSGLRLLTGGLLLVLVGLTATPAGAHGSSSAGLHVIPFPGTPDASPGSQVIFSSLSPSALRSVSVRGSRSGKHAGRLTTLPDGAGTAFVPSRPFTAGEQINVTAALSSPAAGTASGDPGATELHFSFAIAPRGSHNPPPPWGTAQAHTASASGAQSFPAQHFISAPGLKPPPLKVTADPDRSGLIFLTPNDGVQRGPMIVDPNGRLVWFRPTNGTIAYNLEVQKYRSFPALTWFQGGEEYIMGRSYRIQHMFHCGNGYLTDVHEFQITRQNAALIDCIHVVPANLTSVGGPANGQVEDNIIQLVEPASGQVLWEWHSLGHIPISDTYNKVPSSGSFSYFHLNSIQQLANGNLLISARNTWALYEISRSNGSVVWELNGKHSNFRMGQGTRFEWQHHAHLNGNTLTVFDDADQPQEERESSGKELRVNLTPGHRTASLVHRYTHSPPLLAGRAGSMQLLPNGNAFIGWGSTAAFSESTAAGQQIFAATFPLGIFSYRAYRFSWSAQPPTPPHMASTPMSNGDVKVYASWNGATRVAFWNVLGGPKHTSSGWFTTSPRTGFQTVMTLHSEPRFLKVQALDSSHHVLGTSTVHVDHPHVAIFGPDVFVPARGGYSRLPVGCFTGHDCRISVKVSWGRKQVAQSEPQPVHSRTGTLVRFMLSAAGRRDLNRSSAHKLRVLITIHDSSGATATKHMTLYAYMIQGAGPKRGAHNTPTVQIASTNAYVASSGGRGQLLAACYGPSACHVQATITSGGTVIGTQKNEHIGAEELGQVYFQLTQAGQTMLQHAKGNQLAAQVKLSNGHDTATGHIALIGYG
jgi:Arylsulfotransferase (ASST)